MMRKRWVVVRCWAGVTSRLVPQPTELRYWTQAGARRAAARMTAMSSVRGAWYEARRRWDVFAPT